MPPVIIFCCTGLEHVIYCVWSVRSLRALGYNTVEIITSKEWEKDFLKERLGDDISCEVVRVDREGYSTWAYRPFALKRYKIKNTGSAVVVCDTDILWKKDPLHFFNRFKDKNWVHKITSLDPADLNMDISKVPKSRIGLQTMINYKNRIGLKVYPNFHLNCGLFMLPKEVFPKVLDDWVRKIYLVPPKEMIMTEALLSLVYSDLGLSPICDRDNIKYVDIVHSPVDVPVVKFEVANPPAGMFTGYQTAQHYYGDQRNLLYRDARRMGLDYDNLLPNARKEAMLKKIKKLHRLPEKLLYKIRSIW